MKRISFLLPTLLGIVFFAGCSKDSNITQTSEFNTPATDRTDCGQGTLLDPATYVIENNGGNVDILQFGYQNNSLRIDEGQCSGTIGPIQWEAATYDGEECTDISWTWIGPGSPCGVIVILKGSNGANVFTFEEGCTSGSGLNAPINSSGGPAALSNITIGYNTCYEIVCVNHTGWGGSTAGGGSAWWFNFDTQGPATQPIYAGQQLTDGTIHWDGTNFTINLGSWSLDPSTTESVKAQGYNTLPTKRPSPGLFTLYKGTSLTFPGNGSRYYAIHLDLQQCE